MNVKIAVDVHMQRNVRKQLKIELFGWNQELTAMHQEVIENFKVLMVRCYE